jgi:hypothetical protein
MKIEVPASTSASLPDFIVSRHKSHEAASLRRAEQVYVTGDCLAALLRIESLQSTAQEVRKREARNEAGVLQRLLKEPCKISAHYPPQQ